MTTTGEIAVEEIDVRLKEFSVKDWEYQTLFEFGIACGERARKAAVREFDAKYGLVHAENCSRYGYCDISTPCTCGLDKLREEMEATNETT